MTDTNINWKAIWIIALMIFSFCLFSKSLNVKANPESDLKGYNIAIYNNLGTDEYLLSRIALQNMFLWMKATVENITASEIQNGKLSEFDLFVMPGRSESTSYYELEELGVNNLLRYIREGGAYFGICGGASFAARSDVNIFSGAMQPVPGESIIAHMVEMRINTQCKAPNLSNMNETFSILFWGSTYFIPEDHSQINTIAVYSNCNESGMITYRFGLGSVFLSSPHGEFEENSDRDGTDAFDINNDPDSEWELMLKVSQWLVSASKDKIIFIWTASFGGGAIVAAFLTVFIIKKRKSTNAKS